LQIQVRDKKYRPAWILLMCMAGESVLKNAGLAFSFENGQILVFHFFLSEETFHQRMSRECRFTRS